MLSANFKLWQNFNFIINRNSIFIPRILTKIHHFLNIWIELINQERKTSVPCLSMTHIPQDPCVSLNTILSSPNYTIHMWVVGMRFSSDCCSTYPSLEQNDKLLFLRITSIMTVNTINACESFLWSHCCR